MSLVRMTVRECAGACVSGQGSEWDAPVMVDYDSGVLGCCAVCVRGFVLRHVP